jgi:hypothetical protein
MEESRMGRALMIGGVFLLSRDPKALAEWYQRLKSSPGFLSKPGIWWCLQMGWL